MTRLTVLHIASPFAFSMPVPERSAAPATHHATADAGMTAATVESLDPTLDGIATDDANDRFGATSREAVLRRYAALQDPEPDDGSVEPGWSGSRAGGGPAHPGVKEAADIPSQNQPDPDHHDPDQQGGGERRP